MTSPYEIPPINDEPDHTPKPITPEDFERYKRLREEKRRAMFPTVDQILAAWAIPNREPIEEQGASPVPFTAQEYDAICFLVSDQCKARDWINLGASSDETGQFYWTVQTRTGWSDSFRPPGAKRKHVYWIMEDVAEEFEALDQEEEAL